MRANPAAPPAGPPGSRDRATLAAELNSELEAPTRRAVALARNGGPRVLRLCFDRITAPRHARPVQRYRITRFKQAKATAARVNNRLHLSNQSGSITGEKTRECRAESSKC